jgi:pilus assembly protein CpaE
VVIVAASLDPAMMLDALHAGAKAFVVAPLTSDQLDNAIKRVAVPRQAQAGQIIAFVGAKGGVGTTLLAVNTATALARLTKGDALLIDLNTRYGDVTACLGVEPRFTVADALENAHRLDEPFMRGLVVKAAADLEVLAASDRPGSSPPDLMRLRTLLDFAKRQYQFTVLDVPRTEPALLDALESASRIVLVVSQELTAVRSAARMVSTLRQRYTAQRVEIAVGRQDRDAEIQSEDLEKTLGGPVRIFPNDYRQTLECLNRGRPLILENHSRLAAEMNKFVRDLSGAPESPSKGTRPSILPKWLGGHA